MATTSNQNRRYVIQSECGRICIHEITNVGYTIGLEINADICVYLLYNQTCRSPNRLTTNGFVLTRTLTLEHTRLAFIAIFKAF